MLPCFFNLLKACRRPGRSRGQRVTGDVLGASPVHINIDVVYDIYIYIYIYIYICNISVHKKIVFSKLVIFGENPVHFSAQIFFNKSELCFVSTSFFVRFSMLPCFLIY